MKSLPAGRIPPQDTEAEKAILGAVMLDRWALPVAVDLLKPEYFYSTANEKIFRAMIDLFARNSEVDVITVREELRRAGALDQVGGAVYLNELVSTVRSSANIESHGQIVAEKSILRSMITLMSNGVERCFDSREDAFALLAEIEKGLFECGAPRMKKQMSPIGEAMIRAMQMMEEASKRGSDITGIPTGLIDIDVAMGGLHPAESTLVAARPSIGKSSLLFDIARKAAKDFKVAVFSQEMSEEMGMVRLLSAETGISMSRLRRGSLTGDEWARAATASAKLSGLNIMFDDTSRLKPIELRAKARRLKADRGLDLIVTDYIQIMGVEKNYEAREREISDISSALHDIAKDLNVHSLAASQLNRDCEKRSDKKPMLADLRESGSLEQDADNVIMIYRPEHYGMKVWPDSMDAGGISCENQAKLLLVKQRNGPTGEYRVQYNKETSTFRNATLEQKAEEQEKLPF